MERKIVTVSLNRLLYGNLFQTPEEVRSAVPRKKIIKKVSDISKHFVVIRIPRPDELIPAVLWWFRRHNVDYDALTTQKTSIFRESEIAAVDMDGVLCETAWTPEQAESVAPKKEGENIEKVNRMAQSGYFIIIYTARSDVLIPNTLKWLRRHEVNHHAFCNKKMVADHYIDDRNSTLGR